MWMGLALLCWADDLNYAPGLVANNERATLRALNRVADALCAISKGSAAVLGSTVYGADDAPRLISDDLLVCGDDEREECDECEYQFHGLVGLGFEIVCK